MSTGRGLFISPPHKLDDVYPFKLEHEGPAETVAQFPGEEGCDVVRECQTADERVAAVVTHIIPYPGNDVEQFLSNENLFGLVVWIGRYGPGNSHGQLLGIGLDIVAVCAAGDIAVIDEKICILHL